MSSSTKGENPEQSDLEASAASAAPGPYLGYSLQPVRLCFHLLNSDANAIVSIEHLDDVAIKTPSGVVLEQTKSAMAQNPVSNWSPELWKTFANWIDTIEGEHVSLSEAHFRLYVTPPKTGEFVAMLNDATTDGAATQAIDHIEKEFKALKKQPAAHANIERLLTWNKEKQRELIKRFRLDSVDLDPVDPIRHLVRATVSPAVVENCCRFAIGHAKEAADALMRAGKPSGINAGQYRTTFIAFVHKNDLSGLLVSIAPPPPSDIVDTVLIRSPVFVRQLDLIDLAVEHKLRAISDYLQTSANKTKWAELGLILRESIEELDRDLIREHSLIGIELEETHKQADEKARGRVLYARCSRSKLKLEGREVPDHFGPGCYNDLADRLRLGWHSDYRKMLSEMDEADES